MTGPPRGLERGSIYALVSPSRRAREAAVLRAQGEAKAIETVFSAIHEARPDHELLSYQYLRMLPELARGEANKIFLIPSEFSQALAGVGRVLDRSAEAPSEAPDSARRSVTLKAAETPTLDEDTLLDQPA